MKVFITKYALTGGIQEFDVEFENDGSGMVKGPGRWGQYFHGEGREWHRTWESAVSRAEKMRQDKIASIDKQRDRLIALTFKHPKDAAIPNPYRK